jgi:hypothetical protein
MYQSPLTTVNTAKEELSMLDWKESPSLHSRSAQRAFDDKPLDFVSGLQPPWMQDESPWGIKCDTWLVD